MKTMLRSIALATLVGVVLTLPNRGSAFQFAQPMMSSSGAAPYVKDEVLVKFKPAATAQDRTATVMAQGHTMLANLNLPGWVHVKIGVGRTLEETLAAYSKDLSVEYVQPNYIYHAAVAPNDPQYGQLWAFKNTGQTISNAFTQPPSSPLTYTTDNPGTTGDDINIEKAWDHITDCSSIVVAVIDSGVNYNHEDLASNMWNGSVTYPLHGYNYVNNNNDPMDHNGHGTHVAGIIGAMGNNAKGTTGICWKASIMAVRVLDATGSGTTANIIQGINFAVTNGAKVINMSLGSSGAFDTAFSNSIATAQSADVVVVVSAGNDGANNDSGTTPTYPCNFTQPNLLCVAALDQSYQLATFSNYGSTSVDVGASGTNILSTYAGTKAVVTDALTSGWIGSSTTSGTGGGWAYGTLLLGGVSTPFILDSANYPSGNYNNSTDDRAYKVFNLAGVSVALLEARAAINVVNGDHFRIGYSSLGGDPFAGGTTVSDSTGVATYPNLVSATMDISGCISANCSIGSQLQTDASLTDLGVAITGFNIKTLNLNTTSYNTINGTSMASPEVAGLATMLRAYNQQYTYADAINAIKMGGRATASLAGKTTTGNAVDVMSSLAYINPPTGLTATVQ
jgi:thermitase